MGWMDGIKKGVRKVADEAGDLAKIARLKSEVGKLKRDRSQLFEEMGRELYEMHARGESTLGFGTRCQSVDALEEAIRAKEAEIDHLNERGEGDADEPDSTV